MEEDEHIGILRIGSCPNVLLVAVGEGGDSRGAGAGSGSGFIEYLELSAYQSAYTVYFADVVGNGPSTVETLDGANIITAMNGGDADGESRGGNGYSGGGAFYGGAGGCDGGDGDVGANVVYPAGKGNGFNVTAVPLKSFSLRY